MHESISAITLTTVAPAARRCKIRRQRVRRRRLWTGGLLQAAARFVGAGPGPPRAAPAAHIARGYDGAAGRGYFGSSGLLGALRSSMNRSNACLSRASRCLRSKSSKAFASSSSCCRISRRRSSKALLRVEAPPGRSFRAAPFQASRPRAQPPGPAGRAPQEKGERGDPERREDPEGRDDYEDLQRKRQTEATGGPPPSFEFV